MWSDDVVTRKESSSEPLNRRSVAMAWFAFAVILTVLLCFAGFIAYQRYLREPSRNVIKVNADHGQTRHVLYLDRGYLKDPDAPPRDSVVLYVAYPSMLPCARNDVPGNRCMHILIAPNRKKTEGEFVVEQWQLRKNRPDNGSGFDRYIGEEDGYQIYQTLPSPRTGVIIRTRIFEDEDGNLVSDTNYHGFARMLSGIPVRYGAATGHQTTPREMHKWMQTLLNKLTQESKQEKKK